MEEKTVGYCLTLVLGGTYRDHIHEKAEAMQTYFHRFNRRFVPITSREDRVYTAMLPKMFPTPSFQYPKKGAAYLLVRLVDKNGRRYIDESGWDNRLRSLNSNLYVGMVACSMLDAFGVFEIPEGVGVSLFDPEFGTFNAQNHIANLQLEQYVDS